MRRIFLALSLMLAPAAAEAATRYCVAGTGNWTDTARWSTTSGGAGGASAPTTTDVALLDAACEITIPYGTTVTVQRVLQSHPSSVLDVRGKLEVSNCDEALWYDAADPDWCGTTDGIQRVQGTVLHDTETSAAANPWTGFGYLPTDTTKMRLTLTAALDGGAPAVGDWLQITSGPDDGAPYRVAAVSVGSYPTSYTIDIELQTTGGLYGTYADTTNDKRSVSYLTAGTGAAEKARLATPTTTNYDANGLNKVVVVCADGSACNTGTPADTFLGANGAYSGWFIAFSSTSITSGFDSTDTYLHGHRYRILNSANNVASPIDAAVTSIDVLYLADPIDAIDRGATQNATTQSAFIWPGFFESDSWRLFRPATIADTSGNRDGQWGVIPVSGSTPCTDWDNFFMDSFYAVQSTMGDTTCTNPANNGVVQSAQGGVNAEIMDNAVGYVPGGDDATCLGVSVYWRNYDPLTINRVAVLDTKSPLDTTTTCCVSDANSNRTGSPDCGPGTTGFLSASAVAVPDAGTHGTCYYDVNNVTVNHSYCRYMQADCQFTNTQNVDDAVFTFNDPHTWWMHQGISGSSVNIAYTPAAGSVTVNVNRPSFINYTAGRSDSCGGGPTASFKSAADTEAHPAIYHIDGGILLDVNAQQVITGTGADRHSTIKNLFAYGRDQFGATPTNCQVQVGMDSIESSWIDGWASIGQTEPNSVARTFWRPDPTSTYTSGVVGSPDSAPLTLRDNVFLGITNQGIFSPGTTYAAHILHNWFAWASASGSAGIGTWTGNGGTPSYVPHVVGNVTINRSLMTMTSCTGADYDASGVGLNATGALSGAHQISGLSGTSCVGATPPIGLTTLDMMDPRVPLIYDGVKLGPEHTVGPMTDLEAFGIRSRYRMDIGGTGGGGWLPRAY